MPHLFNPKEVALFIILKKQLRGESYQALTKSLDDQYALQLFSTLADEDLKQAIFYNHKFNTNASLLDEKALEEESVNYIRYQISLNRKVSDPSVETLADFQQPLDYAIARQKGTIHFFYNLKQYVSGESLDMTNYILTEEEKYLAALQARIISS